MREEKTGTLFIIEMLETKMGIIFRQFQPQRKIKQDLKSIIDHNKEKPYLVREIKQIALFFVYSWNKIYYKQIKREAYANFSLILEKDEYSLHSSLIKELEILPIHAQEIGKFLNAIRLKRKTTQQLGAKTQRRNKEDFSVFGISDENIRSFLSEPRNESNSDNPEKRKEQSGSRGLAKSQRPLFTFNNEGLIGILHFGNSTFPIHNIELNMDKNFEFKMELHHFFFLEHHHALECPLKIFIYYPIINGNKLEKRPYLGEIRNIQVTGTNNIRILFKEKLPK